MTGKLFEKIDTVSKKARVVTLLRDAILSGQLHSGEWIVEGRMSREFGVGQGVLREALIELEHQGYVQRTPYSGTRVTTLTHDDARHIYDLRIVLEPLAFVAAAPRITGQVLDELKQIAERSRRDYEAEDLPGLYQQMLAFRQLVWSLSGNDYLERTLLGLVPPLYALYLIRAASSRDNREGLLPTIVTALEHQIAVIQAFERRDPEAIRQTVEGFLVRMRAAIGAELLPVMT